MTLVRQTAYLLLFMLTSASLVSAAPCTIAYHSPLTGLLQECDCGGGRKGGVARLKAHIDGIRSGHAAAALVSPGNWLNNYYPDIAADSLCFRLLPSFQFDAIAVGPLDLINGPDFFTILGKPDSLPWVNCNLTCDGRALASAARIISKQWGSILVTGAVSETSLHALCPAGIPPGIAVEDPVAALIRVAERAPASVSAIVVVSYLDAGQEQLFLECCDPSRAVILLHGGDISRLDSARSKASRMVAQMGQGGRCVSIIEYSGSEHAFRHTQETLDSIHPQDLDMAYIVDIHFRIRGMPGRELASLQAPRPAHKAGTRHLPLLTLYYAPGCPDCHRLITDALAPLEKRGNLRLELVDVSVPENYGKLVTAQRKTGVSTRGLPVALFNGKLADGIEAIRIIIEQLSRTGGRMQ